MAGVNKVILVGNLGADPETRQTSGGPVCNLRVATTEQWTDRDGQKQERTEWHSVQVWGKTAEHCAQYLAKGRSVYVEGRLESREYADKDGVKRKVWEVRADKVTFLGTGKGDEQRPSTSQAVWQGSGPKSKRDEAPPFESDPIPF